MAKGNLQFDNSNIEFSKTAPSLLKPLLVLGRLALIALGVALVLYLGVTVFVETDTERTLRRENKVFEKTFASLKESEKLLMDAVDGIQYKEAGVFEDIFHAMPPSLDPMADNLVNGSDSIAEEYLVRYTLDKATELLKRTERIDADFAKAFAFAARSGFEVPPMIFPVENISAANIGASFGMKHNPILKVDVYHNGVDIIVPTGRKVVSTSDGVVRVVEHRSKGNGNEVVIAHNNGYSTRYLHLGTISVNKGQIVRQGQKIGTVGSTGAVSAPHLHYEVLKDGKPTDPLGYIFASLSPEEYANILYMGTNTQQSLD